MKALVLKGRGHIEYISKDIPSLSAFARSAFDGFMD